MSSTDTELECSPCLRIRSTKLGIATFNVRGLQSALNRQSLARDTKAYSIDIAGLQETKITTSIVQKLLGSYVLCCFREATRRHGIAFVASPKLDSHLRRFWSVSDRVGVAEFHLPTSNGAKPSKLFIIVAYGPHTRLCSENQQTRDFYKKRHISNFHRWRLQLYTAGCQQSDEEDCTGEHGKGGNENRQIPIDWLLQHHLFLCNTALQHSIRHRTTWEGCFKPPGTPLTVPVYNTIDFVNQVPKLTL